MSARRLPIGAIVLEATGFVVVTVGIWLTEYLDLPHYIFGAPVRTFRLEEAIVEASLVLLLGAVIVLLTVSTIRQLQRLIVLCAWCKRVRLDGEWMSIETFFLAHDAKSSHGMCPECEARLDAELASAE